MTQINDKDVAAIREWLDKENYLPKELDEMSIRKFLHSCYGSIEQTKQCIEKFCTTRCNMPEIYTARDPLSANVQTAFSITSVASFPAGDNEVLYHRIEYPSLDKFEFYDVCKAFTLQADYWIQNHELMLEGHIMVLDIEYYTLRLVTKVNIFFFQKLLIFLLEAMPVRLKQVIVINCPSYYEKLYGLVKAVLPQEIRELITFHLTHEGLYSHIDKKYIPEEYGGESPSMKEQHRSWVKKIEGQRKMYLNDNYWKADLLKKTKTNGADDSMNGSFRTLCID